MRRLRKRIEKNRRREFVWIELLKDINCFPAGVYRLDGFKNGFYEFSVGNRIDLFASELGEHDFCLHREKLTDRVQLTEAEFLPRYYELMTCQSQLAFLRSGPKTGAVIDPALDRTYRASALLM